ncbi:MAG: ROK family protein [Saprospiraceae bacterium]|nr:ROK family protein [Pyrinomonadaceae bacterium]
MAEFTDQVGNFVGIEVSLKTFNAVRIDAGGTVLDSIKLPFDRTRETLAQLLAAVDKLKETFTVFDKIGIAVPGLIRRETSRVAFSAHIPDHSGLDLAGEVKSATGLETLIENDANAAAYGEFKAGAGRGSTNLFYVTLGAGVGGAFIIDGGIWKGSAGFAGEFGYVPINSEGMRLEDVASSGNIVRRTVNRYKQDSTSSLSKLDERRIGIPDIVAAAENEDDFAQMMLERTGTYVGMAVATVINLLNIEKIVIGGEIMQAKHLVLDAVIARAKELSFAPSFENTEIVAGELGENASAIGVALMANGV